VGGTQWPVLFTFRGWYPLTQRYGSVNSALQALTSGDQEAVDVFWWAGLLHDSPGLDLDDAAALLEEAPLGELIALPGALLQAVRDSLPVDSGDGSGDGGPWDWEVAEAIWSTEWGQDSDRFWDLTFREFHAKSNGRAKIYARSQGGISDSAPVDIDPRELIRSQRRGR
jgi:hypothetical protein